MIKKINSIFATIGKSILFILHSFFLSIQAAISLIGILAIYVITHPKSEIALDVKNMKISENIVYDCLTYFAVFIVFSFIFCFGLKLFKLFINEANEDAAYLNSKAIKIIYFKDGAEVEIGEGFYLDILGRNIYVYDSSTHKAIDIYRVDNLDHILTRERRIK